MRDPGRYSALLADAFLERGLDDALALHAELRRRDRSFGLASRAVELAVPVRDIGAELLRVDRDIGELGLGAAFRGALGRWGVVPRYEIPGATWRVLRDEPFLAIGNHVNGLEVAMFSALFTRRDVYHLAGSFVGSVGPHISRLILPLHSTGEQTPPHGARDRLFHSIGSLVWPVRAGGGALRENYATLQRAADLIACDGAGVQVFPAGTVSRGAAWLPGAGHLVKQILRRQEESRPVSLVLFTYGVSDVHLLASALFRRRPLLRAAARMRIATWLGAPYVYASPPLPLASLGITARTPAAEVTASLFRKWSELDAAARHAIPRWPVAWRWFREGARR